LGDEVYSRQKTGPSAGGPGRGFGPRLGQAMRIDGIAASPRRGLQAASRALGFSGLYLLSTPVEVGVGRALRGRRQGTIRRPHRQRQGTIGHTMEACTERLRHHLRRKNQLNANPGSTVKPTPDPPLNGHSPSFPLGYPFPPGLMLAMGIASCVRDVQAQQLALNATAASVRASSALSPSRPDHATYSAPDRAGALSFVCAFDEGGGLAYGTARSRV
jgi:hypothetical protein